MGLNLSDLPPAYQKQALEKYKASSGPAQLPAAEAKANKYHNQKTMRIAPSGKAMRFDSKKEAARFEQLLARAQAGEIRDLRLQVDFTLQEAYTDTNGERVRAIRYKADFVYFEGEARIVEDVKSRATRTKDYIIKRKLMQDRLGITIREI